MSLPKFHETFMPILEVLNKNQGPLHHKDLRIRVRDQYYLNLPQHLLSEQVRPGKNKLFDRIGWGKSYLKMGKFVYYPSRGMVEITEKGRKQLKTGRLTLRELQNDTDFVAYQESQQIKKKETEEISIEYDTPQVMNLMDLPKFHETFVPVLKVLDANEGPLHNKDLRIRVRDQYYSNLPQNLLDEKVSTGGNKLFNKIDFGKSYLKMGKFVYYPSRGMVEITEKGRKQLKAGRLTLQELKNDADFVAYQKSQQINKEETEGTRIEDYTPQELIDRGVNAIKEQTKAGLLEGLKEMNPFDFEEVVLRLFKKMGYGDGTLTSKTRDGGIDGIINQDVLGLEKIYIQIKHCKEDNKIHEKEIRNFIGAMSSDTKKGIFVTTSNFDDSAKQKADKDPNTIILINGDKLADLMYEHEVDVQVSDTYKLKEVREEAAILIH